MKLALLPLVLGVSLFGQAPPYEVVTVKPAAPDAKGSRIGSNGEGRLLATNFTVLELIANANSLPLLSLVEGLPSWAKSEHYDIEATVGAQAWPTVADDRRKVMTEMLKAILRDRFRLAMHMETKQVPTYILTVDGQAKLERSEDQSAPVAGAPQPTDGSINRGGMMANSRAGTMTARAVPLSRLTQFLTGRTGRPVTDGTGLTGLFDMDLKWTPDPTTLSAGELPPNVDAGSLATALREQLGLKLTSATGPTQIVIVEKVERPGKN